MKRHATRIAVIAAALGVVATVALTVDIKLPTASAVARSLPQGADVRGFLAHSASLPVFRVEGGGGGY
jgi:hypothetical protein